MATTVKLKNKDELISRFTKEVADDLFYFLMPQYANSDEAQAQKIVTELKRMKVGASGETIPFQQGAMDRSNLDLVESYNRIPSDRAQDAIVYFLEEVIGLEEQRSAWRRDQLDEDDELGDEVNVGGLSVAKGEGHKKVLESYPDRDDLEETYNREYILVRDSEGLLFRLTLSHTFLKVEKKYKRPNVTKTKKNLEKGKPPERAPAYQRFWRPIRIKRNNDMGGISLVDYPEKGMKISKTQAGFWDVQLTDANPTLVKEWNLAKASEIGKQNIISLARSLRDACYQIKFEDANPYETFMKSDIMKLFMTLNKVFDSLGNIGALNVFNLQGEQKALQTKQELDIATLTGDNPFANHYVVKGTDYYSGVPNSIVFKVDIHNEPFVLQMLDIKKGGNLTEYKTKLGTITASLEGKSFPGPKQGLTRAYRSIFAFPQARIGMIVAKIEKDVKMTPTLQASSTSTTIVSAGQQIAVDKETQTFFFQLDNRAQVGSKNECSFIFTDYVQNSFLEPSEEEPELLDKLPSDKWALAGQIYYPNKEKEDFSITLTHAFLGESTGALPANLNLDTIRLFDDFITKFASMYFKGTKMLFMSKDLATPTPDQTNLEAKQIMQVINGLNLTLGSSTKLYFKVLGLAEAKAQPVVTSTPPTVTQTQPVVTPPTTPPIVTSTPPVVAQPQPVVAQPQPVVAQPQPVVAQPQPVVAQPQPQAKTTVIQPQPVVAQPQPVVAQPQPVVAQPVVAQPVVAQPQSTLAQNIQTAQALRTVFQAQDILDSDDEVPQVVTSKAQLVASPTPTKSSATPSQNIQTVQALSTVFQAQDILDSDDETPKQAQQTISTTTSVPSTATRGEGGALDALGSILGDLD